MKGNNLTVEILSASGLDGENARKVISVIKEEHGSGAEQCWLRLSREALPPDIPYAALQLIFNFVYSQEGQHSDAPPAWAPTGETIAKANITELQKQSGLSDYQEFHCWSVTNRMEFWELMINTLGIDFKQRYEKIADLSNGLEHPRWLPGAVYNIADSCFIADASETAILWQAEGGNIAEMTYGELHSFANRVANGLKDMGLEKGDAIAIDMPMTAEAVAIYLGIVKMGGAVASIADSLAPAEVEKRLKIAEAKAIFTQDVLLRAGKELPLYEKLCGINLPAAIVLPAQEELKTELRKGDSEWQHFLSGNEQFSSVDCSAEDNCNILFSSGTTGEPKAIPWTHSTPIKCAADGYLHHNLQQGDVVAWPTNIGWMMGPWLIFAGLINKCAIGLYYGTPTSRGFGKFVQDAKVNMLGVVPSMVKRWIETGCMNGLDWSCIEAFSSTGESSNPQDYLWLMARAGFKPVIEYCGGTEIGGGYITGTVVQSASPATFTTPALGLDVVILDDGGSPSDTGELFVVPPSIGLSNTLLNRAHRDVYFEGIPEAAENFSGGFEVPLPEQTKSLGLNPVIRRHGDEFEQLPNGYFRAQGRADDTMNLGGIKTSSVEIERLLDQVDEVNETAAIAVSPASGGPSELVIYAVLKEGAATGTNELKEQFQAVIKSRLNPLFRITKVVLADGLPRTASNKIMRRVLRENYQSKATIE